MSDERPVVTPLVSQTLQTRQERGITPSLWLLLITVPVGATAAFCCFLYASISLCGISGCGGGGFGVAYGSNVQWIGGLLLAGAALTLSVAGPPWWLPHRRRWLVTGSVFALITVAFIASFASTKYS